MITPYWSDDHATIWHANALDLPLEDASVDLVCTSPPYFGLRSYQDGCATCAATSRALNRGYMERYCPECGHVFVSGRNKCHKCNRTTLATDATRTAQASSTAGVACPDCNGTGKGHYAGQIGSEATPAEFVDALIAATREMVRVLKPSGSIFINLGDKYAGPTNPRNNMGGGDVHWSPEKAKSLATGYRPLDQGVRGKSLIGIPWRYALRCIDDLGLILRAEVILDKRNGLPESVRDRVRRSHEQVFHFVTQPNYYSAVDEIRETAMPGQSAAALSFNRAGRGTAPGQSVAPHRLGREDQGLHPLGKLPGSVWPYVSQPFRAPLELGIDHFAAFSMQLPRTIIRGWSPRDVCGACGEGRRLHTQARNRPAWHDGRANFWRGEGSMNGQGQSTIGTNDVSITGYACACTPYTDHETGQGEWSQGRGRSGGKRNHPERDESGNRPSGPKPPNREYHFDQWTPAPTTPGVILDPFGGTGTVSLVSWAEGRTSHYVDLSSDYCRLAKWRINDPGERARAMQVDKPPVEIDGQADLLTLLDGASA